MFRKFLDYIKPISYMYQRAQRSSFFRHNIEYEGTVIITSIFHHKFLDKKKAETVVVLRAHGSYDEASMEKHF